MNLTARLPLRRCVFGAALALAVLAPSLPAQSTLTGRVSNAATGRNLAGATVAIAGTNQAAITDSDGTYRFDDLPAGVVKLSVSYTGLKTEEISVHVTGAAAQTRDVALTSDIYRLDQFVVSGEREGSALAITMQRQSAGVKNVVSTDAFGSLGANPADLLQRLPGVFGENDGSGIRYVQIRGMGNQLNSITMDGNRMADAASAGATREFQFTQVNADTIERIEVVKSPTPDMDADSIGGAVNMVSKSAFDRSHRRTISGQVGLIMRTRYDIDDPRPAASLSYSEVFGGRIGVTLNYGWRRHLSAIPATSRNYENKLADPAYTYQFGTEDYYLLQTRQGGGLKLDYKLSGSTRFYVNLTGNTMYEPNFSHFSTFTTAQTVATRDAAGNLTGTGTIVPGYTKDVTEWRPLAGSLVNVVSNSTFKEVKARHAEIGAVHRWRSLDVDYNFYRSRSQTNYPHQENVTITARGLGLRIENTADPFFPRITQLSGPDISNIASYLENAYDLRVARGIDAYKGSVLNARYRFTSPVPALIKAGVRIREQSRDLFDNRFRWQYRGPDGVMGLNPATGRNDDNLARWINPSITRWGGQQHYARLPWLHYPNAERWDKPYDASGPNIAAELAANPSHFNEDVALSTMTRLNNLQLFNERVTAAYVQAGVDLGPLTILAGVRMEKTETEGDGARNEITPAEAARRAAFVGALTPAEIIRRNEAQYGGRLRVEGEYQQVFPGVHLKYNIGPNLLSRLSYSTNIGRPSIGQLVPRATINNDSRTISTSNPSLKPQTADNFDAGIEYYFKPIGMFSAGVFLKEIKQFIFTQGGTVVPPGADNGFSGDFVGYALTTQRNGGRARVRGFELAYQQQFSNLPGLWKGFGVYANLARNFTKGDYGSIPPIPTTQVAGFIPETVSSGISYIRQPISIRVQATYSGYRLVSVAATQARLLYERARTAWDLKTSYDINRRFTYYLDLTNVFSARERGREWEGSRAGLNYNTGPQLLTGINARY